MRFKWGALLSLAVELALSTNIAAAAVQVAPKHLLILRPGIDMVWGSYIFALQNDDSAPAPFKGRIMLPQETADFQAQEGLTADEVTLADQGVTVEKSVASGVQVMGVGFKVNANLGESIMTFTTVAPLDSLSVLVPKHGVRLGVESDLLSAAGSEESPDPEYIALASKNPLAAGQTFTLKITSVPEGRGRSWAVGIGVVVLLLVVGGYLAWRTRPRLREGDSQNQAFLIS